MFTKEKLPFIPPNNIKIEDRDSSPVAKEESTTASETTSSSAFGTSFLNDSQSKILQRYLSWKKNIMCLYTHIEIFGLESPSRSVRFIPNPHQIIHQSHENTSYEHYTNYPFLYSSSIYSNKYPSESPIANDTKDIDVQSFFMQCMNYYTCNHEQQQKHLHQTFTVPSKVSLSAANILRFDEYMRGGSAVDSWYNITKIRIMPRQPHLICTRALETKDIAVYWLNFDHLQTPIPEKHQFSSTSKFVIPERVGNTLIDIQMEDQNRKRKYCEMENSTIKLEFQSKRSKLNEIAWNLENDIANEDENGCLISVAQLSENAFEGWGLSFNQIDNGLFVTGNNTGIIAVWDLHTINTSIMKNNRYRKKSNQHLRNRSLYLQNSKILDCKNSVKPSFILDTDASSEVCWLNELEIYHESDQQFQKSAVMSVDWCNDSNQIFVSVSNAGVMQIWDRRQKKSCLRTWGSLNFQEISTVSWNPINHSLICTAGKDKYVRIWDIRKFNRTAHKMDEHKEHIYHVQWCPYNEYMLGSSGADCKVLLWDLRRIDGNSGANVNPSGNQTSNVFNEQNIGSYRHSLSPELIFAHCGHTACVSEFDWCPSNDMTIISTDMNGVVHTWQPPSGIVNPFAYVLRNHLYCHKMTIDDYSAGNVIQ